MKKSKVIIPAMALLLFSTAASVTGTVAWFSSTRAFSTSANTFTVKEVEGGLNAVVAGGVATTAYAEDDSTAVDYASTAKKIKSNTNCYLTHGSFNPDISTGNASKRQAWIIDREPASDAAYYTSKGTLAEAEDTSDATHNWIDYTDTTTGSNAFYYVAFSWTIKFSYEFNAEAEDVGLYFDYGASKLTVTPGSESSAYSTALGFRIAFMPLVDAAGGANAAKDGKTCIWAVGTPAENNRKHVVGSSREDGVDSYDANSYIAGNNSSVSAPDTIYWNNTYERAADANASANPAAAKAANKARPERLCTLTKNNNGNQVWVKCVAWFEGMDVNVVSGSRMDTIKANMSFYARSDNTITPAN